MKYDLRKLMLNAWKIFRKLGCSFSEALKRAWITAKAAAINVARIQAAKAAAGIEEDARTWYGWTLEGREVIHEMKSLFQVVIIDGATKTGTRVLSYFGISQTELKTA